MKYFREWIFLFIILVAFYLFDKENLQNTHYNLFLLLLMFLVIVVLFSLKYMHSSYHGDS